MRKREMKYENSQRLVDITGFMQYTGLGRNKALELASNANCRINIGRRVLYDLRKADQYFNKLTGVK